MKDFYFHHSNGKGAKGSITNPPILVFSTFPRTTVYVKLTPEWYKNPSIPMVPLREAFPLSIVDEPETLRGYIEQMARERGWQQGDIYISVYENLVKMMKL